MLAQYQRCAALLLSTCFPSSLKKKKKHKFRLLFWCYSKEKEKKEKNFIRKNSVFFFVHQGQNFVLFFSFSLDQHKNIASKQSSSSAVFVITPVGASSTVNFLQFLHPVSRKKASTTASSNREVIRLMKKIRE